MNIHLMPDEKFIDNFISKVLECSAKPAENIFLIRSQAPFKFIKKNKETAIAAPLGSPALQQHIKTLQASDVLVIHYLKNDVCKWLQQVTMTFKTAWVFWGAEFYGEAGIDFQLYGPLSNKIYRPNLLGKTWLYKLPLFRQVEQVYIHFKNKRFNRLKSSIFSKIDYIYHYNDFDVAKIRENFDFPAEHKRFMYPRIFDSNKFDNDAPAPLPIDPKQTNVMIGNSATITCNHLESFEKLAKDEQITLWVPLSYGNKQYGDRIIEFARKKYGDQFKPILDYYTQEEYFALLRKMDVCIMGHRRSQGMGNITTLLYLGVKLFMEDDITSTQFLKSKGFHVYGMKELNNETVKAPFSKTHKEENQALGQKWFQGSTICGYYKKIF